MRSSFSESFKKPSKLSLNQSDESLTQWTRWISQSGSDSLAELQADITFNDVHLEMKLFLNEN